jgi:hypothetical protein
LPHWEEFQTHAVFVLNGTVVHREDYKVDVERPIPREVLFTVPTGADFVEITPAQALSVTVRSVGSDVYYIAAARGGA